MRSVQSEVLVPLPHLVAIMRLPQEVSAGGVTVSLTGVVGGADVVGSLRAHVAEARWCDGRRTGAAQYEVMRTHVDKCAVTVVLDGISRPTAHQLAEAVRRQLVGATPANLHQISALERRTLVPVRDVSRPA